MGRTLATLAVLVLLLAPDLDAIAHDASGQLPAPRAPPETLLSYTMLRLAQRDASALEASAPLHGARVAVPDSLWAPVVSPPPLDQTLAVLEKLRGGELPADALQGRALPAALATSLSALGQALLGAETLRARGDATSGAALLERALVREKPTIQRETILFSYDAYRGLSRDATRAETALALAKSARDESSARAGLGLGSAPPVAHGGLPQELAAMYAALGIPVDEPTRDALAILDGQPAPIAAPLADALAHATRAVALRNRAFAGLSPADVDVLGMADAAARAAGAPDPAQSDLDLLVAYGEAAQRFDADAMRQGEAELFAAADALGTPPLDAPAPLVRCVPACAPDGERGRGAIVVGSLTVEFDTSGYGDVLVRVATEGGSTRLFPDSIPSFDAATLSLTVSSRDGPLLVTPPLADPAHDVLLVDPTGLVVVSGAGTTISPQYGNHRVVAVAPDGTSATMIVNPGGAQMLRWDFGGDDVYTNNAGGAGDQPVLAPEGLEPLRRGAAGPGLPVALLVDDGGNDTYATQGRTTLASANASLALIVDSGGRDSFAANAPCAIACADAGGIAALVHRGGSATYDGLNDSVAAARGQGVALLVDGSGDDRYHALNRSLAHAALGTALLLDAQGNDTYESGGSSQAASDGGVAVLVDAGGDDRYVAPAEAQGWVAPNQTSARIAILFDADGTDAGACSAGRLTGLVAGHLGRPTFPTAYDPGAGFCIDANLLSLDPTLPPTFFASSFGNFTIPQVLHVGSLGDDIVTDPTMLSIDVLGNDTYTIGALAVANATRSAPDLGFVAPVSLLVDSDGDNVFDGSAPLPFDAPGRFAFADGGIALEATFWSRRINATPEPSGADAMRRNESRLSVESENYAHAQAAQDSSASKHQAAMQDAATSEAPAAWQYANVSHPFGTNRYLGVRAGIGAAENHGVAIALSDGYASVVDAPADARCRLACARHGGVALVESSGGPGDVVNATPGSLGDVDANPAGGFALYLRRDGTDAYLGSNETMGIVRGDDVAGAQPSVALFVKDGFALDDYAPSMGLPGLARLPRGNDAAWQDAFNATRVAQGIDNLDWYLQMNEHAADRGLAPGAGQASLAPQTETVPGNPVGDGIAAAIRADAPVAAETLRGPLNQRFKGSGDLVANALENGFATSGVLVPGVKQLADAVPGSDPTSATTPDASSTEPAQARGRADSVTGPYGVQPVTLARTALSPVVELSGVEGDAHTPGAYKGSVTGQPHLFFQITPPALDADAQQTGYQPLARIELSVRGTGSFWHGCPDPTLVDRLDPEACLVLAWTRDAGDVPGVLLADAASNTWELSPPLASFIPGPYVLTARAFADKPTDAPWRPFPVTDPALVALSSDAINYTDDSYGYFGGSYSLSTLVYPLGTYTGDVVSDATSRSPALFSFVTNQPGNFTYEVTDAAGSVVQSADNPAGCVPDAGQRSTPLVGDAAGYYAQGYDRLDFSVDLSACPVGGYNVTLHFVGEYAARSPYVTTQATRRIPVYLDDTPPSSSLDKRATPLVINATNAPNGAIPLGVPYNPLEGEPGQVAHEQRVHLWVQQDVLDASDSSTVIQSIPWRYVGVVTLKDELDRVDGCSVLRCHKGFFQGDLTPGPPRIYRFAGYVMDGAGNVAVAHPESLVPKHADVTVLYDLTPPRTSLSLLDPPPELGRLGRGNVTLQLDASQTPDLSQKLAYAFLLPPEQATLFQPAMGGVEPFPAAPAVAPNMTLDRQPRTRLVSTASGLVEAGAPLQVRLLVNVKKVYPGTNYPYFDQDFTPLWLDADVLTMDNVTVSHVPLNVSRILGSGIQAQADAGRAVELPGISAPDIPGIYRLRIALNTTLTHNESGVTGQVNVTNLTEPFVAWSPMDVADDGRATWTLPSDAVDGEQALFISRGIDRAGNVEPKLDYDVRVDVDLRPPALSSPPTVSATSGAAHIGFATDEPATATLWIDDGRGNLTRVDDDGAPQLDHDIEATGLAPDARYAFSLEVRDLVGNEANLTGFAFHTPRFLQVAPEQPPAVAAQPFSLRWSARDADAGAVLYDVTLSLDNGSTYPIDLAPGGLRFFEAGNATHELLVDPTALPESRVARIRIAAHPIGSPEIVSANVTSPFLLDGVAPSLNVSGADARWHQANVTLTLHATDGASGVVGYEVSWDNATYSAVNDTILVSGDAPRDVWLRARDAAGNVGAPQHARVLLDTAPPTVALTLPRGDATNGATLPVEVRAQDDLAGIAAVRLQDDAGWNVTLTPRDFVGGLARIFWTLGAQEGPRILHATAVDAAGNAASAEARARVDRTPATLDARVLSAQLTSVRLRVVSDKPGAIRASLASSAGIAPVSIALGETRLGGLRPGRDYTLAITLTDAAGNQASATVSFRTAPDLAAPTRVGAVESQALPDGKIVLSWNESDDDAGPVLYRVLAKTSEEETLSPVATVDGPFWIDAAATPGRAMTYEVVALDGAGNLAEPSSPVTVAAHLAPRIVSASLLPQGGTWRASVTVVSREQPNSTLLVGDDRLALAFVAHDGDRWTFGADVAPRAASLGEAAGWSVDASVAAFRDRYPALAQAPLPFVPHESRTPSGLLGAARVPPVGLAPMLLALATLVHFRRRLR